MTPSELREARLALGMTQTELGRKLGMHFTSIYRMEKGRQMIRQTVEVAVRSLMREQLEKLK